jgi:hypothetical protein
VEGRLLYIPSATVFPSSLSSILPLAPEPGRPGASSPTHLLDVVVGEGSAILELLAGEDQSLLIRGDALLVLDLGLDIVNGVRGLDLKSDGLAREGLHETGWCIVSTESSRGRFRYRREEIIELTSALLEGQ